MPDYPTRTAHILSRIHELAAISEDATGATVTRTFGTPAFLKGRDLGQCWFEAAGLETRLDGIAAGQGLLNFFLKALNCGAISEEDIVPTGPTIEEIETRSFYRILQGRRKF